MDLRVIPVAAIVLGGVAIAVRIAVGLVRWARRNRVAAAQGLFVETLRDRLGRLIDELNGDPHSHGHDAQGHCDTGSHGHGGWSDIPDCGGMDGGGSHE